jgi:Dolichyl-phosphate-mannose-protein mannosyltransferase
MTEASVVSPRPATQPPPNRALASWFPWSGVVLPWLVSRVYSGALLIVMSSWANGKLTVAGFEKWDGGWYWTIGRQGYGPPPVSNLVSGWPFFPVVPGVVHVFHLLGMGGGFGALVVNQVAFLIALAGLFALARRRVSNRAAVAAVWSLALFPTAFVFSMLYPSSIFLAASVWAFLLVEDRHDWWAGIVVALAVLTRPNGIVLAVALGVGLVVTRHAWRRALVVCAPGVAALSIWCALCYRWTGNPVVFLTAKKGWVEITIGSFLKYFWHYYYLWPHLILAVVAVVVLVKERNRLPWVWTLFTVLYLLPSFGLGMVGLGRYANECFPPFVAAGALLERQARARRVLAFTAAIAGQAVCALLWIRYNRLP